MGNGGMVKFVVYRDLIIFVVGIWFFEFHMDYKLPNENNLLLFFVAIPIIWATLMQMWTSFSYDDAQEGWSLVASHILSILILAGTTFILTSILNTMDDLLTPFGDFFFHLFGWTVLLGIMVYDIIDIESTMKKEYYEEE